MDSQADDTRRVNCVNGLLVAWTEGQSYKEFHENSTNVLSADTMADMERQTYIRRYF
jgi:hypothetical protein